MTRSSGQRVLLAQFALVLLLLVACGSSELDNAVESMDAAAEQPQASRSADGSEGGTPIAESHPETSLTNPTDAAGEGPGALFPASFSAMLGEVGDHRIEVSLSFEGKDAEGAPVAFTTLGVETAIFDPPRSRLDLSAAGSSEPGQIGSIALLRVDEAGFLYVPQIGCVSGNFEKFADEMALPLDPRILLEGVTDVHLVANDVVVNGLDTSEFGFDEASLPWSSGRPWSITGSAFVEQGSDFVTRVAMTLNGRGDLLGDGHILDGAYDVVIDIAATSSAEAVAIPDACRASARYPVTPDAFDITVIEDLLTFKSRMALEDVADFYSSQMPSAGWQLLSEPGVFDDLAIMNFEKGGVQVLIVVEYDAGSDTVSVLISP